MRYTCTIASEDPALLRALEDEASPRAGVTVNSKIHITADDAVALRAMANSVSKLCIVYEKMKNV